MYMNVTAVIERANDGSYSVYMDATGMDYLITGTGETADEAIRMFKGGYEDMKRCFATQGKKIEEVEFLLKYDIPSFLSYYSKAFSLSGLSRITGINQGQLSHYLTGRRTPSHRTVEKMQNSIKHFAEELSQVRFV
jgi:predicted HTH domain antitoxin